MAENSSTDKTGNSRKKRTCRLPTMFQHKRILLVLRPVYLTEIHKNGDIEIFIYAESPPAENSSASLNVNELVAWLACAMQT